MKLSVSYPSTLKSSKVNNNQSNRLDLVDSDKFKPNKIKKMERIESRQV